MRVSLNGELVAVLILLDQCGLVSFGVEFVEDEGLRRPVARAFCPALQASVAFRLGFIAADFSFSAFETTSRSFGHFSRLERDCSHACVRASRGNGREG